MFELILFIAVCLYFIQIVIFIIGASKKFPRLSENDLPKASIIVAARNEAKNIINCLESLNKLEYPKDKLEIIIVDDNSTDNTGLLTEEYIKDKSRFVYTIAKEKIGRLKGKANAIANGISLSNGEIILTTDADCIVSPTWAKTIASYYTKDVGIVCGYTAQYERDGFSGMQSMDFIYLLTVAAGTMNLGKPLSAIGNNMSYSRKAYDEVGGYAKIPFSVTEDFKLLMSIYALKKYKLIYPMDSEALVTSEPCENVKEIYWQKKRWGVGGLDSDIVGYGVMASGFICHLFFLLAPFIHSRDILIMLLFKIIIDSYFLRAVYNKLKLKFCIKHFMVFEIYFILYVIILPFMLILDKRVKWKGREF